MHFRILVPTDYSPIAVHASIEALRMAEKMNCRISFIHYFTKPWLSSGSHHRSLEAKKLKEHLVQLAAQNGIQMNMEVDFYAKDGRFETEILNFVSRHRVSLVIMGTNGASRFGARLFGSNSINLIRTSYVPVLAIPESAFVMPIENLVYATDYSDFTGISFDTMMKLAKAVDAKVTILHVKTTHGKSRKGWTKSFDPEGIMSLHKYIEFVEVREEDVLVGIEKYIAAQQPSFLTMSAKHESALDALFRQSVFQNLMLNSKISILAAR